MLPGNQKASASPHAFFRLPFLIYVTHVYDPTCEGSDMTEETSATRPLRRCTLYRVRRPTKRRGLGDAPQRMEDGLET